MVVDTLHQLAERLYRQVLAKLPIGDAKDIGFHATEYLAHRERRVQEWLLAEMIDPETASRVRSLALEIERERWSNHERKREAGLRNVLENARHGWRSREVGGIEQANSDGLEQRSCGTD